MKLRARFPQIGLARPDSAAPRRAFWPTSRSGSAEPAAAPEAEPKPALAAKSEFTAPADWPSTVAAWRSTTGRPGDRT